MCMIIRMEAEKFTSIQINITIMEKGIINMIKKMIKKWMNSEMTMKKTLAGI